MYIISIDFMNQRSFTCYLGVGYIQNTFCVS